LSTSCGTRRNILASRVSTISYKPNEEKKKLVINFLNRKGIAYLIPIQQETIYESPNDACTIRIFDLLLHRRDLRLAPHGSRIAERSGPLLVQVVVRGVIIRYARDALDGAQERA
jgi:hypothetical protein